jgi:hypothetical protein
MPTDDDRFDDDRRTDEPRPDDEAVIRRASEKTSTVGLMMILASVVMFLSSVGGLYLVFGSGEDLNVRVLEWFKGLNQDPRFQADIQKQIDDRKNMDPNLRMMERTMNVGFSALGLAANTLVLIAGIRMRALKSYVLCVVGCVASFAFNGCCCVGLPVGVWAIVVLVNADVKAGFEAMKRRSLA